ncbi:MAG: glycogen/starch/alpha-glucan phosphorylase [Gammaproteobacteria bacterium]|nr:glycogen/starch/alpha-glucan phosphorylase [Gammaproteobacteria bacterium]MDH3447920.1 glycogen/starch/alpha-glucan phosphorylase [Gammaproteobacteria bacterium]
MHNKSRIAALAPPGHDSASLMRDFRHYFNHTLGRDHYQRTPHYEFLALAMTLRDRLMEGINNTRHSYEHYESRRVCYLSMEYLLGRSLRNAAMNLDLDAELETALEQLGLDEEELIEQEHDAGLGNGGLGRLAACFLDSCATLGLPVIGYGIRYQYGMFRQKIVDGYQVEEPDPWLRGGHPWEIERSEYEQRIHFGGRVERYLDENGRSHARWVDTHDVLAVPFDIPVPGYRNGTVNTLRLWSALATDELDLDEFNAGSYTEAVAARTAAENITMVLYPNDASENGKELRLRQQFFLASASLKDVFRQWVNRHGENFDQFAEKHCFQLNDTHPSIAVAELMRLLIDVHGLEWDDAWKITGNCMAYTNHTLLPEALERWPVRLFGQLLPRVLEIIGEINNRFVAEIAARWPGDVKRRERMAIIEDGAEPMVRMAHLAIVGSYSVNGVAELHSRLLKEGLFRDFHELWPTRMNNKTNGVTQRRWLRACNPGLSKLITASIGDGWVTDLDELGKLAPLARDAAFRESWHSVKQANKHRIIELVRQGCGIELYADAIFDVQVKRMHEYKRQLLNVLHVIHLLQRIHRGDTADWTPRCVLIGGKAAPGYFMAKLTIKLINSVARVVDSDPRTRGLLRLVFLPNYNVSTMETICPGCDLSEQISTAGKEASGTGNMKFMINGALTIGTLDGANIEIRDAVGADNFFLCGMTAEEVVQMRRQYDPKAIVAADDDLREVMEVLQSGQFNQSEPGIFDPIIDSILSPHDAWMTAADFASFVAAQRRVATSFRDRERWTEMSILNTAASGRFSSDRTIREYNRDIWRLEPVTSGAGADYQP